MRQVIFFLSASIFFAAYAFAKPNKAVPSTNLNMSAATIIGTVQNGNKVIETKVDGLTERVKTIETDIKTNDAKAETRTWNAVYALGSIMAGFTILLGVAGFFFTKDGRKGDKEMLRLLRKLEAKLP